MYVCIYVSMCIRMYVCMYVCADIICTHVCTCMHAYVHMYQCSPRIFLRRLAITNYYTDSKPSLSNGYAMLLLQYYYNGKPNMQVNQRVLFS